MGKRIVGFFSSSKQADTAKDHLLQAGFTRDEIGTYSGSGGGLWEEIKEMFGFADEKDRALYQEAARRGAVAVWVSLGREEPNREELACRILESSKPVDLDAESQKWRAEGWTGNAAASAAPASRAQAATSTTQSGQAVVPVVEEQINIGKRQVQNGGLRIYSHVTETPVEQKVQLREEHVNVERRPANRPVTDADQAFHERAVEVSATSEEAVVSKQARVVEEVVVNKDVNQRTETVRDTVRRTDVEVERAGTHPGQDVVADRFAQELAASSEYRGCDWKTIEPDARRAFEKDYPGSKWEQVKDAVHRGYDRLRQKV